MGDVFIDGQNSDQQRGPKVHRIQDRDPLSLGAKLVLTRGPFPNRSSLQRSLHFFKSTLERSSRPRKLLLLGMMKDDSGADERASINRDLHYSRTLRYEPKRDLGVAQASVAVVSEHKQGESTLTGCSFHGTRTA